MEPRKSTDPNGYMDLRDSVRLHEPSAGGPVRETGLDTHTKKAWRSRQTSATGLHVDVAHFPYAFLLSVK